MDIFGYLKNTHKNPKFGRVRQVPIRELGWEFPGWDLSHFAKFGIFMGILQIPKNIQKWESVIFSCDNGTGLSMLSMINKWMAVQKSNDSFLVIVFYINNGKVQVYVNNIIMHFLSILNRLNWINTN